MLYIPPSDCHNRDAAWRQLVFACPWTRSPGMHVHAFYPPSPRLKRSVFLVRKGPLPAGWPSRGLLLLTRGRPWTTSERRATCRGPKTTRGRRPVLGSEVLPRGLIVAIVVEAELTRVDRSRDPFVGRGRIRGLGDSRIPFGHCEEEVLRRVCYKFLFGNLGRNPI